MKGSLSLRLSLFILVTTFKTNVGLVSTSRSGYLSARRHPWWRTSIPSAVSASNEENQDISLPPPPPPPPFVPKPLPIILGAGLFLFSTSVAKKDKEFAAAILQESQTAMRADPTIGMELGQALEAGGVYASLSTTADVSGQTYKQLVLQFQIEGGNAWAQGVAYGVQAFPGGNYELVSLEVANMDATMNGTPFEINVSR